MQCGGVSLSVVEGGTASWFDYACLPTGRITMTHDMTKYSDTAIPIKKRARREAHNIGKDLW
jgi:hypothetical protein